MSRYKRDGRIPSGAVNALVRDIEVDSISKIAVSGSAKPFLRRQIQSAIRHNSTFDIFSIAKAVYRSRQQPDRFLSNVAGKLADETSLASDPDVLEKKMEYVGHHRAHAAGAYYTSGFDEATVITVDSAGDDLSSTVYHGSAGNLKRIAENDSTDSVGMLWSRFPTVFGFKGARHAGKFMGLAAYANDPPAELHRQLEEMISVDGLDITNSWAHSTYGEIYEDQVRDLRERFGEYPAPQVARALQHRTKDVISEFARNAVAETGCPNVAVSGGVMANVKVNQCIYQLPSVERIWVQQAMSDSGLCIGGACVLGHRDYGWQPERLSSVALGPLHTDSEVERAIHRYEGDADFEVIEPSDVETMAQTVGRHLAENSVVCVFRGRMEYGPRALGQRSILYQPTDPGAIDWLNKRLNRTEFMPFAPVTLQSKADECYEGFSPRNCPAAHHMTISLDCTDTMKERSPGVVHVDGTARPQIINDDDDPLYYHVLQSYYEETGIPTLINTSFNMHGEPIVRTPAQAFESWLRSNNEILVMEDRILKQEGSA